MIVWLASYPRSGNTLVRQILYQAFGQNTYSRYNDPADIGAVPQLAAAAGHVEYEGPWEEFYRRAVAADRPMLVKIHDPPPDDAPAIHVVRDGRAAAVSWMHKMRARRRQPPDTLDAIIEGRTRFGGWSGHLDAWRVLERPRTLLLRFEDLTVDPQPSIARLSGFLGLPQVGAFHDRRKELRAVAPEFVGESSNTKNIAELSLVQRERFHELHGRWLGRLGYTTCTGPGDRDQRGGG